MITLRNWVPLEKTYAHTTRKPDTTPPLSLREWDRRRQYATRVPTESGETMTLAEWRMRERTRLTLAIAEASVRLGLPNVA